MVYAEFANILRDSTVLIKGEKTLSIKNWIDQKTGSVSLIAVFSIPSNSITTLMHLTWEKSALDGSGRFSGQSSRDFWGNIFAKSTILSYKNIPPDELNQYLFYIIINMVLNVADIFLIVVVRGAMTRKQQRDRLLSLLDSQRRATSPRRATFKEAPLARSRSFAQRMSSFSRTKTVNVLKEQTQSIRGHIQILTGTDVFDVLMRIGMMALCWQFYRQKYYSSNSDAGMQQTSPLDQFGKDLLAIDWTGSEGREQN